MIIHSGHGRTHNLREADDSVQTGAVQRPAHASTADFPLAITDMPINATQRRLALGVVVLLFIVGLATAPFAGRPAARIDAFVPVLQTLLCFVDLVTAALLLSQYSVRPRYAILAVASGYLFSGLFAFAQTLAFPGAYSTTRLIGHGDTASWLFVFWHTAFTVAVLIYAISKDQKEKPKKAHGSSMIPILTVVAVVIIISTAATFVVSSFPPSGLIFYVTTTEQTVFAKYANIFLSLLNVTTLTVLFLRRRTILDLWLMVTLFAWLPNFLTAVYFTFVRFSIGWYVSRCFSIVASSTLLFVLLAEMTVLYARLANSITLSRRERAERLASVEAATSAMAHEIRQPLAGIANMGAACLNWLKATPANIERARECVTAMVDASHRAGQTISVTGGLFRKAPRQYTTLQLNDLCQEAINLMQHDILTNGISVRVRCRENLPLLNGDYTQIQQVILNLIRNAIDAMSARPASERHLRLSTSFDGKLATLCVRDSGPGVAEVDCEQIFQPFYSTKSNGMGLGLAISRKIIEEHGGTLRLAESQSQGSMFEIALPVSGSHADSAENLRSSSAD